MRRWFLSYHSPDEKLAERLKHAVESKNSDATVFFAPVHLRAGGFWQQALAREIDEADGFILLIGKSVGHWQELEYYAALDRRANTQFPLIPIVLQGETAPGLPFLRQLHWIVSPDPASDKDVGRLVTALSSDVGEAPHDLWRFATPYRGLSAMEETDADYFFGRQKETNRLLDTLASCQNQLPIVLGNSGVGKSSLVKAGVIAALRRQARPEDIGGQNAWPEQLLGSRLWCYLQLRPGGQPLKALVKAFLETWHFSATDPERVRLQNGWTELLRKGEGSLCDLMDATERRYSELQLAPPPVFFIYIDQGEELYARSDKQEARKFSEIMNVALVDARFRAIMSLRSDFLGDLQRDEPLFDTHQKIDIAPLREAQLREVVGRPAKELSARFESATLIDIITRRAAEDSADDVGALPLLSYTLDDMWSEMVRRGDGVLRLPPQSFELGGVLVERANAFIANHAGSENVLRRIFTLRLATVHDDGEPTRRRAPRSEFSNEEWALNCELADHPNRLLIVATPADGETYVEVAHEALFRRWSTLKEWVATEREFLAWKTGLESARRVWRLTSDSSKSETLLMGAALTKADFWYRTRQEDLTHEDKQFIRQSSEGERRAKARMRLVAALAYASLVVMVLSLLAVMNARNIADQWRWWTVARPYILNEVRPYVLNTAAERRLRPGDRFKECARYCPEMVVVPGGTFNMGSLTTEKWHRDNESPQHPVTIGRLFAVSRLELTFEDWDACVSAGGCTTTDDGGWGRGVQPVINVSWNDARRYVAWLSKVTGKEYRLLTEAEWEYSARAGTGTAYYWGNDVGHNNANCSQCGSHWDNLRPAPAGSFAENPFHLKDMAGNVLQWVEDCYHKTYGSGTQHDVAKPISTCENRVVRGGAWDSQPRNLRSAYRGYGGVNFKNLNVGFRLARTLEP